MLRQGDDREQDREDTDGHDEDDGYEDGEEDDGEYDDFFQHLGARRRRTPRTLVDLKVHKDTPHQELSDATLRFDLVLGVRRRRALKSGLK